MQLNKQERSELLHQLVNMGENMIACGGEVSRVEGTLIRMGNAYGALRMNVLVITASMVITMFFPDHTELTETRRLEDNATHNYQRLEAYNALSRECCRKPLSIAELTRRIEALENGEAPSRVEFYVGSVLAAGAFAVFFGGNLWDGLAAAIFALFICFLQEKLPHLCSGKFIYNTLIALLSGFLISLVCLWIPALHQDKIIIGDIMLLIPGIAMTGAVRDILVGDTITGLLRLVEALLWAGGLAIGFMIALALAGAIV